MIVLADKQGRSDGVALKLCEKIKVGMPILLVTRVEELQFNEQILELEGKPYVLIDMVELNWDWHRRYGHVWGVNTPMFPNVFKGDEWTKVDEFIKNNPPKISFIREVLVNEVTDKILPISYPCFLAPEPIQTKEEFQKRIFQTIFSWGLSHEYRKELHGQIWINAGKHDYTVLDNLYYINNFIQHETNSKKWITVNIPWYNRFEMEDFIKINGMAKISVSIAGAGRSCFRHSESPVNSAMLMWDDNLAWHKDIWVHGVNCIKCEQGKEIGTIIEWLNKPNELYEVYVKGVATVDKFRFDKFIPYLEGLINKA